MTEGNPEGGPGEEDMEFQSPEEPTEVTPERTKESEIKANVEFWQDLGVEVDEADVRAKIEELPEVEGMNYYLYFPKGVKTSDIFKQKMEGQPYFRQLEGMVDVDRIKQPRSNEKKSYVVACRYQREPDEDTLGDGAKSAKNWKKAGRDFMSLPERMIAEMRWYQEQGTHLDEKNKTLCPGDRAPNGDVPDMHFYPGTGEVRMNFWHHDVHRPDMGIRRVITKDTKV